MLGLGRCSFTLLPRIGSSPTNSWFRLFCNFLVKQLYGGPRLSCMTFCSCCRQRCRMLFAMNFDPLIFESRQGIPLHNICKLGQSWAMFHPIQLLYCSMDCQWIQKKISIGLLMDYSHRRGFGVEWLTQALWPSLIKSLIGMSQLSKVPINLRVKQQISLRLHRMVARIKSSRIKHFRVIAISVSNLATRRKNASKSRT